MSLELREILQEKLARPQTGWSIGVFGALAEFHRERDEPAETGELQVATARGAIRLSAVEECRPVPFAPRSAKHGRRDYGVGLCLPESSARIGRNAALTELGPDRDAIRPRDRDGVLFDLGLDTPYGVFCIHTADPEHLSRIRSGLGSAFLEPQNPLFDEIVRMSPHRVFMSRLGRIEVYQRIGEHGGTTPHGPHTHLLPKLVRRRRTHSANVLLPAGLVPCVAFHQKTEDEGKYQ